MKNFYVSSYSSWFIVQCRTAKEARREGAEAWGKQFTKTVREATEEEVAYYDKIKPNQR